MDRDLLIATAERALRSPQHAPAVAREVLALLDSEQHQGTAPSGYVYAGAHTWEASSFQLAVEPLPEETPPGPQIWTTGNEPVQIQVPFDALIQSVSGFALIEIADPDQLSPSLLLSGAPDNRDLFSVSWDIDGQATFVGDGRNRRMFPASCIVGTRLNPRPLGWTIRRNQTINVRFRNLINAIVPQAIWDAAETEIPRLAQASITFRVLNLGAP